MKHEGLIDLHLHTQYSDGRHTPQEVLSLAQRYGIGTVAITDHDTVAGIAEGRAAAEQLGMRLIPAIELYSRYHDKELHILGYNIDERNQALLNFLNDMQRLHREWLAETAERLARIGFAIDGKRFTETSSTFMGFDEIVGIIREDDANRAKINRELGTDHPDLFDIINTYFLRGDAYLPLPEKEAPTAEVIHLIHGAGGVAVLAHPGQTLAFKDDDRIGQLAAEHGLDGLEAVTPHHTWHQITHYLEEARRRGLFVTAGSDFHGTIGDAADFIHTRWDYFLPQQTRLPWEA